MTAARGGGGGGWGARARGLARAVRGALPAAPLRGPGGPRGGAAPSVLQLLGAARWGGGAAEREAEGEIEWRAYGPGAPKAMGSALEEASRATSAERERGAEEGDWFAPRAEPSLWRLVKGNLGFLRPEGPAAP